MEKINLWNMWEKEWKNANKYYKSKGNIKTRSKLKTEWNRNFMKMLEDFAKIIEKGNERWVLVEGCDLDNRYATWFFIKKNDVYKALCSDCFDKHGKEIVKNSKGIVRKE